MELKTDVRSITVGGSLDNGIRQTLVTLTRNTKHIHIIMNPQSFNPPYL